MKKLIMLWTFSLLFIMQHDKVKAQNIINGDFSIGQNTGQHANCLYFDQGYVPNWFRSHGTPHWNGWGTGGMILYHGGSSYNNNPGEGIVGGYNFIPGLTYTVQIKLNKMNLYGSVDVYATTGITERPLALIGMNNCIENENVVTPTQSESIGGQFLPNMSGNTFSLTYSPTMANSQIWIYFTGFNGGSPDFIEIDWVKIWPCTQGSKHYPQSIDPGLTDKELITTGSGALPYATNVANWATTFIGADIQLNPWTVIDAFESGYFLAIAVDDCVGPDPGDDDGGGGGSGKPGRNNDDLLHFTDKIQTKGKVSSEVVITSNQENKNAVLTNNMIGYRLSIYPNPTTGSFHIEIPQKGNYTIRVTNMLGSTVYEGNMTDEQKKSIQLGNNLPPGNYTLLISGDGLRHVERITLIK